MADDPKWTPGPWASDYLDQNGQRVVSGQHIEICTCWHHSVGSIEKEMEANAHLIAAAPDLYAALDDLLASYAEPDQQICCGGHGCGCRGASVRDLAEHHARTAIAKARGAA